MFKTLSKLLGGKKGLSKNIEPTEKLTKNITPEDIRNRNKEGAEDTEGVDENINIEDIKSDENLKEKSSIIADDARKLKSSKSVNNLMGIGKNTRANKNGNTKHGMASSFKGDLQEKNLKQGFQGLKSFIKSSMDDLRNVLEGKAEAASRQLQTISIITKDNVEINKDSLEVQKDSLEVQKDAEYDRKHAKKESLRKAASNVKSTAIQAVDKAKTFIPDSKGGILGALAKLFATGYLLKKFWPLIKEKLIPFLQEKVWPVVKDNLKEIIAAIGIGAMIMSPMKTFMLAVKGLQVVSKALGKTAVNMAAGMAKFVTDKVKGVFSSSNPDDINLDKDSKKNTKGSKGLKGSKGSTNIKGKGPSLSNAVQGAKKGLGKGLGFALKAAKTLARFIPFLGIALMAYDVIDTLFPELFGKIGDFIGDFSSKIWDFITEGVNGLGDWVASTFSDSNTMSELGSSIWESIKDKFSEIGDWVAQKFSDITGVLEEKLYSASPAVAGMVFGAKTLNEKDKQNAVKTLKGGNAEKLLENVQDLGYIDESDISGFDSTIKDRKKFHTLPTPVIQGLINTGDFSDKDNEWMKGVIKDKKQKVKDALSQSPENKEEKKEKEKERIRVGINAQRESYIKASDNLENAKKGVTDKERMTSINNSITHFENLIIRLNEKEEALDKKPLNTMVANQPEYSMAAGIGKKDIIITKEEYNRLQEVHVRAKKAFVDNDTDLFEQMDTERNIIRKEIIDSRENNKISIETKGNNPDISLDRKLGVKAFGLGGFTGAGKDDEIAGFVHKNEFVLTSKDLESLGAMNGDSNTPNTTNTANHENLSVEGIATKQYNENLGISNALVNKEETSLITPEGLSESNIMKIINANIIKQENLDISTAATKQTNDFNSYSTENGDIPSNASNKINYNGLVKQEEDKDIVNIHKNRRNIHSTSKTNKTSLVSTRQKDINDSTRVLKSPTYTDTSMGNDVSKDDAKAGPAVKDSNKNFKKGGPSAGSFRKPKRFCNKTFIHCTDSDREKHDSIDVIRDWHKEKGWSDIGYHYMIHKDGKVSKGRPIEKIPAQASGNNTGSIGIVVHGKKKSNFTGAQMKSLQKFCSEINDAYEGEMTFHGHTEVSSKSCPVFDYINVLKLDNQGKLGLKSSNLPESVQIGENIANDVSPADNKADNKAETQENTKVSAAEQTRAATKSIAEDASKALQGMFKVLDSTGEVAGGGVEGLFDGFGLGADLEGNSEKITGKAFSKNILDSGIGLFGSVGAGITNSIGLSELTTNEATNEIKGDAKKALNKINDNIPDGMKSLASYTGLKAKNMFGSAKNKLGSLFGNNEMGYSLDTELRPGAAVTIPTEVANQSELRTLDKTANQLGIQANAEKQRQQQVQVKNKREAGLKDIGKAGEKLAQRTAIKEISKKDTQQPVINNITQAAPVQPAPELTLGNTAITPGNMDMIGVFF